tara:strand:- start:999 stop:1310 length:312 start_codon:yes stop_codon:yes gene_type:complete
MKKINIVIIILLLHSCGGFSEAGKVLRNEKIRTTDEFLVKKKEPLVMPPGHNKIPEPGSIKNQRVKNDEEKIKKILKVNNKENNDSQGQNTSIEKSILNEIKK